MGGCRFEKISSEGPDALLARARKRLQEHGGTLEGDLGSGRIEADTPLGKIRGRYTSSGDSLVIVVDEKPALLPCSAIGAVLDRVLHGRDA
jgi:hypothetical protein